MAYSNAATAKLFNLLPAYLRDEDARNGGALKALLGVVEKAADDIEDDIRQLHANAFIETCEPWVVPYIGELVGNIRLSSSEPEPVTSAAREIFPDLRGPRLEPLPALRTRADVARTIYYRRRKGTLPMLEELARDITGWPTHAVEFFGRLLWTQAVRNRLRMETLTPDLRKVESCRRLNSAFDGMSHTVDVRPPSRSEGWYNIRNIGFFLWRLGAYPLNKVTPRRAGDFRYHFSPLGNQAPLFSARRREAVETELATELDVPQAIRPARFHKDLADSAALASPPSHSEFYGPFDKTPEQAGAPNQSIFMVVDGIEVPAASIRCADLSTFRQPADATVLVDVARGRFALGALFSTDPVVEISYHYGFPADLGGGPYQRQAWLTDPVRAELTATYLVNGSGLPGTFSTIGAALQQWKDDDRPRSLIRISDNRSYVEAINIELDVSQRGEFLAIEAADGMRPHLQLTGAMTVTGSRPDFVLTLAGLLIEGQVRVEDTISRLRLVHSTLVPGLGIVDGSAPAGEPSIVALAGSTATPLNVGLSVELAFSISGAIALPRLARHLILLDSIVDGALLPAPDDLDPDTSGPMLYSERSTVRGTANLRGIEYASTSIFENLVTCERVQKGCVRFSYVHPLSRVPRRYRCQPDLAEALEIEIAETTTVLTAAERQQIRDRVRLRLKPEYTAEPYGQPAYLQLALDGPPEIATGAEDGSEMGAYCHLKQPQRERNLSTRLEEYLPFGLDYGIIYVT
ncbi:hypothetical protein [Rhizobium grahamii]|uniref:Uncharacterized protein n=1 Tax=Rhizobium grahamii CCGE 502 TaxID=990285 RepID=S3HD72_9HYPH|nr:hypothetical protein [Rhizobium grahamii]EPE96727.1 hypothetical protein RGCCGE502_18895 [Rhizobium grahamii CCGE 502]